MLFPNTMTCSTMLFITTFLSITENNALNKQAWQMYPNNGWDRWGAQKAVYGQNSCLDYLR